MRQFDEMYSRLPAAGDSGEVRAHYAAYARWLKSQDPQLMAARREEAEVIFRRVGITFAVYGDKDEDANSDEGGTERLIPFDLIPRVIAAQEWKSMEAGLVQRVTALNRFIHDVYHDQDILKAGIIASLPAICGFVGGVLGGVLSDGLLRRGHSLTFARKAPIIAGLLVSSSIVACNYVEVEWMVVGFMALAFFGKGVGALGWAVVSDTSPKQIAGLSGGLFNTFGNIASITTPIVIGYIISSTGSFKWALVYVGANALVAVFSYLVIVGPIKRVVLKEPPTNGGSEITGKLSQAHS